jgi:fructose-bisphosphate aldolase class II
MNIDTDTQFAFSKPVGVFVKEHARAFEYQVDPETGTPYKKQYDPRAYLRLGEEGIVARLLEACDDLGSKGKSIASA